MNDDTMLESELTTEMKQERIAHLNDLLNHPGWQIIRAELDSDIRITESKLFGEVPLVEKETVDGLQRERIDRLELRDLPANLIKEYAEQDAEPPNHDPYA